MPCGAVPHAAILHAAVLCAVVLWVAMPGAIVTSFGAVGLSSLWGHQCVHAVTAAMPCCEAVGLLGYCVVGVAGMVPVAHNVREGPHCHVQS